MQKINVKKKHYLIIILFLFFYFSLTLFNLVKLPVFADEAIYIRWTQLIIDDWQRYFFFPMNDGKTPLQMWLMIPFQFIFKNQLFAGRFLSVLIGAGNILLVGFIAKEFNHQKYKEVTQYLAMFLTSILPFTFFHHRMALTDALLFFNLNLSFFSVLKYLKKQKVVYLFLLVLSFFLALFSKLSALLYIPSLLVLVFYQNNFSLTKVFKNAIFLFTALLSAILFFYSFKFLPVFPQIFSRGGDFLYPFDTIFKREIFNIIFGNLKFFYEQYFTYFGAAILFLVLFFFNKKYRKVQLILLLTFFAFIFPLACLGKIIYPRYLLPTSLFIIILASLNLNNLINHQQKIYQIFGWSLMLLVVIRSFKFIIPSYFAIDNIPFSQADRVQYLEEWSSGQGIYEISQLILNNNKNQHLAVATEGYFGTLPDGILMYLHQRNVDNLMVEGIGQPISIISNDFLQKAQNYQRLWLVVNSHRLKMQLDKNYLIQEYCRPNDASCLQVWDISFLLDKN